MEIDELGLQTAYEYDSRGNQTALVKPDGTSLQVSYNEDDLPLKAIDAIGCVWKWSYNSRGQLTKRLDGVGHETKFGYSGNRLTSLLDPANQETVFVWDTSGNLECITTPDGTQTRWQYDWLGRPTAVTNPAGMQRRTYDLLGRIVQVAEPDGNLRSLTYDSTGNLVHAKDLQHDVRFTYQGMGRMASRREAGTTVEFRYNTEEDLIGIVNEHGCVYRFELDERREVTREFGFDNIRRIYTRDDAGRVVRVERASGLITWYEYDLAGRVVSVRHSDKSAETFVYRADGELMEATNDACTIKFERDPSGRILKEWQDDYWVKESNATPWAMSWACSTPMHCRMLRKPRGNPEFSETQWVWKSSDHFRAVSAVAGSEIS